MSDGTVRGLDAIRAMRAKRAAEQAERDRPKANWLNSKAFESGPITVRFLQEMDEENEFYDKDRGIGFVAVEHNAPGPEGWKRRALCTIDSDGRCYACESHRVDPKAGWRQKTNLYIQVLADLGEGPKTYVLSRNANSAFFDSLLMEIEDEGNLTQANYRITKTGVDTGTNWIPKRLNSDLLDDSKAETFPAESIVRKIDYDKQPEFYGAVAPKPVEEDEPARKPQTDDDDW